MRILNSSLFLQVEWYFNNKTINYTSRIVKYNNENNYSLLIRYVTSNDSGSYTCRASNSMGITEKIIELSQIANPAVFKKESGSASSTSYNFIWVVDSYSPIIEYQFLFRRYKVRIRLQLLIYKEPRFTKSWENRCELNRCFKIDISSSLK